MRRYITRPAVSTERLSLTAQGHIRYRLKTLCRGGTTAVVFEPHDKIAGRLMNPLFHTEQSDQKQKVKHFRLF